MTAGRTSLALVSAVVLCVNGYAWGMLQNVNGGIRGNDVIGGDTDRADGATDILLVGSDSRTDAQGNPLPQDVLNQLRAGDAEGDRTDSMILMRIPNGGGRASAMSFPRDTEVDLDRGYGPHKLTEAFSLAKTDAEKKFKAQGMTGPELERQSRSEGQKFLIQTIDKLAGLKIDHYAEVNLLGFFNVTKAIGGVDVCLKPVKGGSNLKDDYSGANFRPGPQTIDGSDALAFVRQRHGLVNELDRVKRQQVFMSAMAKKMLQGGTLSSPTKLSGMLNSVKQTVILDKGWDVLSFAQQMQGITGGNIEFQTAPVKFVGASGKEKLRLDPTDAANFAKNLLLPPQQRAAAEQKQKAEKQARSGIKVNVFNSTKTSGLADKVQESLTAQGYGKGQSSNGPPRPASVVEYGPGQQDQAQQVAQTLGGIKTEQSPKAQAGQLDVYVGDDYKGPGKQSLAGPGPMKLDGMQQAKPSPQQVGDQSGEQESITADGVPCVM
jgi:LCP family protein required for cell wall assembly